MTLEIHLENIEFTGPLDLLLKLVRRNEMDLAKIDVRVICDQFIAYVEKHKLSELDEGYSFLVLASTLLEIKSRMLLPASAEGDEAEAAEEESLDEMTRDLVDRLTVYASFQNIAQEFEAKLGEMSKYLPGGVKRDFEDQLVLSLKEVSLFDLMQTFEKVLNERKDDAIEITNAARPIEEAIEDLLADRMIATSGRRLSDILSEQPSLLDLVVTFLAVLELISSGKFDFKSDEGDVLIVGG